MYALALSALAGICAIFLLGLSGWFLTTAGIVGATGAGFAFNHLYASAGVRAAAFGRVLSRYGEQVIGHDAVLQISASLRPKLFAHDARASRGLSPLPSGELSALVDDVEAVEGGYLRVIAPAVATLAAALTALAFAFAADVLAGALALIAFLATCYWLPKQAAARSRRAAERAATATHTARVMVATLVENATELDVYGALDASCADTEHALSAQQKTLRRVEQPFRYFAFALGLVAAAVALAPLLRADAAHIALCAGATLALLAAFESTSTAAKVFYAAPRAQAAARKLNAHFNQPETPPRPALPHALSNIFPITTRNLRVAAATDAAPIAISDVNIARGDVLELIGPSGSGKTTFAETLMRLQPLIAGELSYAGQAAADVSTPSVLAHVAISPQFPGFIPGNLRRQFQLARPSATDAEIFEALRTACIDAVVDNRPNGLDALIERDGSSFSGGELRRIGLARALLASPQLLILDEPFAGLDGDVSTRLADNLCTWVSEGDRAIVLLTHAQSPVDWRSPSRHQMKLLRATDEPLAPA
jgi:ATP-binding cassette subfamily C protein CydC